MEVKTMNAKILETTADNFRSEVLEAALPVLIEFGTDNCPACRLAEPVLDRLADEYDGRVLFAHVDAAEQQELASAFGVRGVPAFAVIRNRQLLDSFVGAQPPAAMRRRLDAAISARPRPSSMG
jgi:thioredoxin-like negative regulator of GroEL